mgnify:CR=1 FL=1
MSVQNKIEELEEKIDIINDKLDNILNILESNVKPNCEKMSSHITFVESVYNNIKEPMYYVCSQIRSFGNFRYLGTNNFRYLSY